MLGLGPHAGFIVAAYSVAAIVVLAMIAWVAIDRRRLKQQLGDLESSGVTRHSRRKLETSP